MQPNQPTAYPQEFAAPANVTGDRLRPAEMAGKRFIFVPVGVREGFFPGKPVPNTNPPAMTNPSDAIEVDVLDIDRGETWLGVMFGQVMFLGALKPMIGQMVLARVTQGVARGGNNAPWLLESLAEDAQAVEAARRALSARPAWRDRAAHEAAQAQQATAHHGAPDAAPSWAQPAQPAGYPQGYGAYPQAQPNPYQQAPPAQPAAGQYAPGLAPQQPWPAPAAAAGPPAMPPAPPGMDPAVWAAYLAQMAQQQG